MGIKERKAILLVRRLARVNDYMCKNMYMIDDKGNKYPTFAECDSLPQKTRCAVCEAKDWVKANPRR